MARNESMMYYEIDLWTGEIAKKYAKDELDLKITLANGDCKKSFIEAKKLSDDIIQVKSKKG